MGQTALVASGDVHFNSKLAYVDSVQRSELNLLGKIGAESVFGMERDDSPENNPDTEKEGPKPDVKAVKSDKSAADVDQWYKWSVFSFDNLHKWSPVKN